MEQSKRQKELNHAKIIFDTTIKEIELKIKDMCINDLIIKDNLNKIKKIENENNFLDDILYDKKSELNLLKQLLILKQKKKLNFEDIISKYLDQLVLINDKVNNKIDMLKQNNLIINKKKKVINTLFDNLNNEFNNYLNKENKDETYTKLLKEKTNEKLNIKKNYSLLNVLSNGNNKEVYKKTNMYEKNNEKNNMINGLKTSTNINNIVLKLKNDEIKDSNIIPSLINNKNQTNKNRDNNHKFKEIKIDKNKFNSRGKKSNNKSYDNHMKINQNINKKVNNSYNNKDNNKIKNDKIFNIKSEKYNFKVNKNLQTSRENLKYLILKNENEKQNKEQIKKYNNFIKLIYKKINNYYYNINRRCLNILIKYNIQLKLKNLLNNYINNNGIIISKIKIILQKCSLIYNNNIHEEVINEDLFLNKINQKNVNKNNNKKKYSIEDYKNNLNKIKGINEEIKELENKILTFANKILTEK